jgi:hypothetical protein
MYARVALFEGGSADAMRADAEATRSGSAGGPPPGVPATGITCLYDYDSGKSIAIVFFASEEDMKAGDAALNEMSPPFPDAGTRTSVSFYEAPVDVRA